MSSGGSSVQMAAVISKRVTAQIEGDFVVFLIGIRINKPWKIHKWLPAVFAMPKMLCELAGRPDSGFLGTPYSKVCERISSVCATLPDSRLVVDGTGVGRAAVGYRTH